MDKFEEKIKTMDSKEDFISFIDLLINDLRRNPDEWENNNIESYLEAIASSTEDMDGYYQNKNIPIPQDVNWKVFANILITAKMYE